MSGTMTLPLCTALSITATGTQAPIQCNPSPFEGGRNRNAWLVLEAVPAGGGVIEIMGTDLPAGGPTPAQNDPSWAVLYTINASSLLRQEIELPVWIMMNVSTEGTGTFTSWLEGIK
jgi:hypothetical protein